MSQLYDDEIFGNFFKRVVYYQYHIALSIIFSFASLVGYNYYIESMKQYNASAADYYALYTECCQSEDLVTSSKTLDLLKSRYNSHFYTSLATLEESVRCIREKNFDQASHELLWVADKTRVSLFRDLAHYKLAEISMISRDYKKVFSHIKSISSPKLKVLGQRIEAISLANQGLYQQSSELYASLIGQQDDTAFNALLTREYHITNLLKS
jgi:predicted negative regulator of RcsB-dependent stress response